MRKSPLYLFMLVALTLAFGACKKDDDETKTEKLVDKNWRIVAITADPAIVTANGTSITDVFAQLPACFTDDLTVFKTDGKVNYDEGASKCTASDPQTTTGTWVFNTDETILTVDGESATLLELTNDQLKVKYNSDEFSPGIVTSLTFTYKKN